MKKEELIEKNKSWKRVFIEQILAPNTLDENSKWKEIINLFKMREDILDASAEAELSAGQFTPGDKEFLASLPCFDAIRGIIERLTVLPYYLTQANPEGTIHMFSEGRKDFSVFEIYIQTKKPVGFDTDVLCLIPEWDTVLCVEFGTEYPEKANNYV